MCSPALLQGCMSLQVVAGDSHCLRALSEKLRFSRYLGRSRDVGLPAPREPVQSMGHLSPGAVAPSPPGEAASRQTLFAGVQCLHASTALSFCHGLVEKPIGRPNQRPQKGGSEFDFRSDTPSVFSKTNLCPIEGKSGLPRFVWKPGLRLFVFAAPLSKKNGSAPPNKMARLLLISFSTPSKEGSQSVNSMEGRQDPRLQQIPA